MKSKLFNKQSELIHQSKYAKILRPLLPVEAFYPDSGKLGILLINIVILVLGWTVASQLDRWSVYFLWLYLPLSIIMANSIIVLAFSSHDLLHGSVIHKPRLTHVIGLLGWTMLWMPPSLWKIVHNRIHHNHTNSLTDPDRGYLYQSPNSWGKRYCNWIFPSLTVHPLGLALGMITAWGKYSLRNLSSVLLFNGKSVDYVPASFSVKPKERLAIASELFFMIVIHLGILIYLQFDPLQLFLAYFLPMGLSSAGMFFYIHTNHFACQMTEINDPLINSISIKIPKFFDILHLNFSYHTEHHIFPSLNSDYYPMVRELLKIHFPERMGYLMTAQEAWHLLMTTPRLYKDETTFTDSTGTLSVPCHLHRQIERTVVAK